MTGMTGMTGAEERAARLLRWYPAAWRSRFGEEFAELLIADIRERPRSWTRTADVVRGGIVARLAGAGLCGCAAQSPEQVRVSLAALVCSVAVFLGCGAAQTVRRTPLTPGIALFEARIGVAACAAMVVFLGGCCSWLLGGGQGPGNLFHAGVIDVAGVAVMTIALVIARQAAYQARRGGLRLGTR